MIQITFPDGAQREFEQGITGLDIVSGISKSLTKKTIAMKLDGVLCDITDEITANSAIEFITRGDNAESLELIRHDCAHVLAEAVQELWPDTQVTIGPVIENGFYYDFQRDEPFRPEDLEKIEKKMAQIIDRDAPFTKEVWSRDKAKQVFADKGEHFKVELVDAILEDETVKIYAQGDWFDLCRGPHMPSTGKIGKAFKLMKVAGSYWRGDAKGPQLQRIYGTAWHDEKALKAYLTMLEEAEKRDHRKLGREMDLYHFQDDAPGTVFWHPKGWRLYQTLIDYMRRRQNEAGFLEVNAPQLLDKSLWETSGHWEKYHENMFTTTTEDDRTFALKPMNCPGHVQIFKNGLKSYRELPFKIAEFGVVHRYEPSGALHGLLRVRAFTQDDAHIFCTEDQIAEESLKVNDLILSIYKDFGFEEVNILLSTRPEKRVGEDYLWDKAEKAMGDVLEEMAAGNDKITTGVNPGEGAFYGPKFEYVLRDAIGRTWQCGTNQVDFNLPGRFGAFYIDANGEKTTPVMLHRAMFGSLERFIGILIENYAGRFPLWLAPVQVVVAPITSELDDYAKSVHQKLLSAGLNADIDLRNEKINYKVREHSVAKVPVIFVCGRREEEENSISIRRLGSKHTTTADLETAIKDLIDEATPPDIKRKQQG